MKKLILAASLPFVLNACSSVDEAMGPTILTPQDLQHHRWVLAEIDGKKVPEPANKAAISYLEIGENMYAGGLAGCNTFQGQAMVDQESGEFKVDKMAMTMKMCADSNAMATERAVASTLSTWSKVTLSKDEFEFKGDEHTLTYKLSEWMN